MNSTRNLGTVFLEEFVKRIIIKSLPKAVKINKEDGLIDKIEKKSAITPALKIEKKAEEKILPKLPKEFLEEEKPKSEVKEIKETKTEQFRQIIITGSKEQKPAAPKAPGKRVIEVSEFQAQRPPIALSEQKPTISLLDRLKQFIADPAVSSINCPGPGREIMAARFGVQKQTGISLNKEEIKDFLKYISDKTRVPLIPGMFKVIYQNLTITAVVSEYVGSKFIIEKKPSIPVASMQIRQPFQPPARARFR